MFQLALGNLATDVPTEYSLHTSDYNAKLVTNMEAMEVDGRIIFNPKKLLRMCCLRMGTCMQLFVYQLIKHSSLMY